MIDWIFRRLEPRIQAAITDRIVTFYEALVERGQIAAPPSILPVSDCSRSEHTPARSSREDRAPRPFSRPLHRQSA